jgi:hypothetical protein
MVHVSNGQDEVIDLYFTVPNGSPMKLEGMTTQGLKADVQWEPWTGKMADPLLKEGPIERRGWKIQIFVAKPTLVGRLPFSLIADPGSLNLGQIGKQAARGAFFITRPERPFQITKLEQDSEFINAFIEDIGEDDRYKVIVDLSADAPFGMFRSYVTVHTTDPRQPTIRVPVRAIIQ